MSGSGQDPGVSWKFSAIRLLGAPDFPRVFDLEELVSALESRGLAIGDRSPYRALREWASAGVIRRVARGIYLNMQAFPQPLAREAVAKMRPGAIVSLATVLGDAGVLNNPTSWVMAVLPSDAPVRHANKVVSDSGEVFQFAFMRPDLLPRPGTDPRFTRDALDSSARVPTATPEKALLDWIYLSSSSRGASRWHLPASHDIDMDYLDNSRLERLSQRMGLEGELHQFKQALETTPKINIRRKFR